MERLRQPLVISQCLQAVVLVVASLAAVVAVASVLFRVTKVPASQSCVYNSIGGWDKSPSLSIVFRLSSKTQWLSGLYYADFISFYSPTQLCGGGTTKSNSNELPISVPLSFSLRLLANASGSMARNVL